MKGETVPRLYTPPLPGRGIGEAPPGGCPCGCALTPGTSWGFNAAEWVGNWEEGLGLDLHPFQKWLYIHALELDELCERYRFRTCLVLVARQNGKTKAKSALTLWRMFDQDVPYLVGVAQDLSQAREVMNEVLVPEILRHEHLKYRFDPDADETEDRVGIWHKTLNDEYFRLDSRVRGRRAIGPFGPRYLIKALNRKAGRGLAGVGEVNIDELREQWDFEGWAAISKVTMALVDTQTWCMSNAGDKRSALLHHLRSVALAGTDDSLFLAEWSATPGCAIDDEREWARANPSLGYPGGVTLESIRSASLTDPPAVFRTEVLCQDVAVMATAVDEASWRACADPVAAGSDERPAIAIELAGDGAEVVAVAANRIPDGRYRVFPVGRWESTAAAKAGLKELRSAFKPRALGWFPKGPAATLSSHMRSLGAKEIKGDRVPEACMTFASEVEARAVLHSDDPALNAQVESVGAVGDAKTWIFDRTEAHWLWAAAGALHLLMNDDTRKPRKGRRVIVPD